jgi:multiple sugar transport system permease protein
MSREQRASFGYSLLAPQSIGYAIFALYPLAEVFRLSLFHVTPLSGQQTFIGLGNYIKIFSDPDTPTILLNTGFLVALLSVFGTIVALALAILLNQKLPGINIFRAAIFIPALVTMIAWTIVWRFILQPNGLLDSIVSFFGLTPLSWLREHWLTLTLLVFIQLLKNVGLYMMIFLAALQAVPSELLDASKVDGANAWRSFRYVTVPEISPSVLMVFMLMIVSSFKVFEVVFILTDGGPGVSTTVLSYAVYDAFRLNNNGYASAFGVVLFGAVLILTVIVWQLRRRFVSYENE